ncbi:hypothetical protein BS333_17770 [Vibrio azureus]|uniref:Transposase n=1 Tax=Vibrio azureus NBRC 104587 TaxID=1219077 RepID=U3C9G0_9VIBR|nr:hypothetical protein BS333_17770 [Vibrio azureus]GAD77999.1 hypothetical protein VAZ01S_108_00010 [Vibrio azureus NBRC 104587]
MLITMSEKDIYRFKVLSDIREKRLRQVDAAVILNVSGLTFKRIIIDMINYMGNISTIFLFDI